MCCFSPGKVCHTPPQPTFLMTTEEAQPLYQMSGAGASGSAPPCNLGMAWHSFSGRPGIKKEPVVRPEGTGCKQILKNRRQQITKIKKIKKPQTNKPKKQSTGQVTPHATKTSTSTPFSRVAAAGAIPGRVTAFTATARTPRHTDRTCQQLNLILSAFRRRTCTYTDEGWHMATADRVGETTASALKRKEY